MVDVPPKFQPFWPRNRQEMILTVELGVVLRQAMHRILDRERFTGPDVDVAYTTNFPMPDGTEWEVEVRRKKA